MLSNRNACENTVKCIETRLNRAEFVRKLMEEMIKIQPEDVGIDEIMSFIEDILRYLEEETEEEH